METAVGEPYVGGFARDDRWQHRGSSLVAVDPRYVHGSPLVGFAAIAIACLVAWLRRPGSAATAASTGP